MKSEPDKYHHLLENLPGAFAYHQVVTDKEGTPVDYIFLEINGAFEEMTGLKREKVIGKKMTAVLPGIGKSGFDWIDVYGRVALTGEPARFENYSEPLGRFYDVNAYSDRPGYFVTVFRDITEQKRTETEALESKRNLEETTQRLEYVLSLTGTGFDIVDAHYNLHYVDHLWQKVYGSPVGRKCYEYFKDRDSPCETCGIPRALATKQVVLSEQVLPKENNRIVEVHTTPFQNPQGEWLVAEFNIDITERKRVEQTLKESETKFRSYIDNAPYGVFVHNEKGEILEANKTACLMSGYSEEELLGMNLSQLIPQTDRQQSREQNRVITEQGGVFLDLPHIRKDGTLRVWSVNAVKLSDTRFLGITQDITEKRQAEEALKESEMRSQAMVKAIPDLLFRFNREGVYLEAVVKEEEMLHTKERELFRQNRLIGKAMAEVLPPSIADNLMTGIEKTLASGEIQIFEYSYNVKGSEHYFEARLAPIGTTELVSIVRDITERKSHEAKLQYISFHDQLTGLYNRRYYENELKRLDNSREHPIAVISADLDGLKLINDTLGHLEGDNYLKTGAELLIGALRTSDILARVGGDEFAVVLPNTTLEVGQRMVERIRHQIAVYNRQKTTGLPFSMSIGLAVSESGEHPLEETYKKADAAMYEDKQQRRK